MKEKISYIVNTVTDSIKKPFKKIAEIVIGIDWAHVKVDTYVRYVLMILTIVNTILNRCGKNPIPFSEEQIYTAISDVVTILILIVNTYKDNPTSKESIDCTDLQRALKSSEDLEEIQQMLEDKLSEIKSINSEDDIDVEVQDSNIVECDEEEVTDGAEPIETEEAMEFDEEEDVEESEE